MNTLNRPDLHLSFDFWYFFQKSKYYLLAGLLAVIGIATLVLYMQNTRTEEQSISAQLKALQQENDELRQKQISTPAAVQAAFQPGQTGTNNVNSKVNLNTAQANDLDALPGIGPAKAKAIIDYRTVHHGFKSLSELKSVKGIGDKTYADLRDQITL